MKQFLNRCLEIKRSILAFAVALVLNFLSLGMLGLALYYLLYPLLAPFYGNPNDWHGDWVWPVVLLAGMAWPFSFLGAGLLNRHLEQAGWPALYRKVIYVAVLWLGALLVWLTILGLGLYQPSPTTF